MTEAPFAPDKLPLLGRLRCVVETRTTSGAADEEVAGRARNSRYLSPMHARLHAVFAAMPPGHATTFRAVPKVDRSVKTLPDRPTILVLAPALLP